MLHDFEWLSHMKTNNSKEPKSCMQVIRSGEMDAEKAEKSHFTGTVWQVVLQKIEPPNGMNIYSVLFEPKARTAWHSHPGGQILYVTSGKGRIVCRKGSRTEAFEVRPGDIVHIGRNKGTGAALLLITYTYSNHSIPGR